VTILTKSTIYLASTHNAHTVCALTHW